MLTPINDFLKPIETEPLLFEKNEFKGEKLILNHDENYFAEEYLEFNSNATAWKPTESSVSSTELISYFKKALEQEIAAIKNDRTDLQLSVTNGEFLHSASGQYVYRFLTDSDIKIQDDTPVDIFYDGQSFNGYIVSTDSEGINVAFGKDMGDFIEKITIITSTAKLVEELLSKYNMITSGEFTFNDDGGMKLFGFKKSKKLNLDSNFSVDYSGYNPVPNTEQQISLSKSLMQEVTFIWGPPGTGKTKALSIILDQLVKSGKKVLLTSHTNLAVDEILLKFVESHISNDIIDEGKVIRYGTPNKTNYNLNKLLLEHIVKKKSGQKYDEIEELKTESKSLKLLLDNLENKRILDYLNELDSSNSILSQIEDKIVNVQDLISTTEKEIFRINFELANSYDELEKYKNKSIIKKVFSKNSSVYLEKKILDEQLEFEHLNDRLHDYEDEFLKLNHQKEFETRQKNILTDKVTTITNDLKISPEYLLPLSAFNSLKNNLNFRINSNNEKIASIEREIELMMDEIFENALAIGCTLTKSYLDPKIFKNKFDVMILDEASMAQLPAVFFAAGLVDNSHYIIAGDFRQLPPITRSNGKHAKDWLCRDIFAQSGIESSANSKSEDSRLVMLKIQYRMHPAIANIINIPMYNGELITEKETEIKKSKISILSPFENQSLVLVDTSSINPWCKRPTRGSRLNLYSAVLSINLAKRALESGINNVGIITPYKAQANFINSCLKEDNLPRSKVIAATIHKFQGNERECIIFDTVDGAPEKAGILLRGPFPKSNGARLINVAISRAEGKFIFIGNSQYIQNNFDENDAIINVIQKIRESGQIVDSKEILPSYFDKDIENQLFSHDGKILTLDQELTEWNENNFYRIFKKELKNAQERVVIYSPFIARKRLSKILDVLRTVADRNVDIYIVTRKPIYQGASKQEELKQLIEEIRVAGIHVIIASGNVNLNEKLHEKIALIDKKVFFYGSLNILSQSDSSESMLAIRSSELIDQLIKSFNIEKVIRQYNRMAGTSKSDYRKNSKSKVHNSIMEMLDKEIRSRINEPYCPNCKSKMVLTKGIIDPYFYCPIDFKKGNDFRISIPKDVIVQSVNSLKIHCKRCDKGYMRYRVGKYGPFLGCSEYPECKFTLNLD